MSQDSRLNRPLRLHFWGLGFCRQIVDNCKQIPLNNAQIMLNRTDPKPCHRPPTRRRKQEKQLDLYTYARLVKSRAPSHVPAVSAFTSTSATVLRLERELDPHGPRFENAGLWRKGGEGSSAKGGA